MADSPDVLLAGLKDIKTIFGRIASETYSHLQLNSADLGDSRPVRRYLWRGYLLDLALARQLEAVSGILGFENAVRQAWSRTVNCSTHDTPNERKRVMIFELILGLIEDGKADFKDENGFVEKNLALNITKGYPGTFPDYCAAKLGTFLSGEGIGTRKRKRPPMNTAQAEESEERIGPSETINPKWCVFFSAAHIQRMKEVIDKSENAVD